LNPVSHYFWQAKKYFGRFFVETFFSLKATTWHGRAFLIKKDFDRNDKKWILDFNPNFKDMFYFKRMCKPLQNNETFDLTFLE
jgi:hypothetical protein